MISQRTRRSLTLATVAALSVSCAEGEGEGEIEQREVHGQQAAFRTKLSGDSDHGAMTSDALWFLHGTWSTAIADANEATDSGATQFQSRNHVDNCRFAQSFDTIDALHEEAVRALDPRAPNLTLAAQRFGSLTHTAQDFYAHSNWTESEQGVIANRDALYWPAGNPGDTIGEMMVLGNPMPSGATVVRDVNSRVPLVTLSGVTWMGLMSGTYDNTDSSICPSSVALEHGNHVAPMWTYYGTYLAKDGPFSPHHDEAVDLATEQTLEEFCRLDRLVRLRYGEPGHRLLLEQWVADDAGFEAECGRNRSLVAGIITRVTG